MPTYEYKCRSCGHTFDVVQAMSEESMTVCPECGGELRKVFAPPSHAFKGSGFYATDHGKKSKKAGDKSGDVAASSSESKSDSKSDSKSAEGGGSGEGSGSGGSKDAPKPAADKKPAKSSESKS